MYFSAMEKRIENIDFMRHALAQAAGVLGTTSPNPAVGAIVVQGNDIVGVGATSPVGGSHAEVHALQQADEKCQGADLYVTLEPCCHYGKTPPCTKAILAAGISRVFVAIEDPNPLVAGKGIAELRAHGVTVEVGLCREEAHKLNEHFFHFIQTKEPWISVKMALSLDGYIADASGNSRWITGVASRHEVHRLRALHTAIAVGSGTLLADNPQLTVRGVEGRNPMRVIFSGSDTVGSDSYFRAHAKEERSIIVVSSERSPQVLQGDDGVEYWYLGTKDHHLGMQQFLSMAGENQIDSLFVEGGSALIRTLLELQKVNRLYLFYAPILLGGGKPGFRLEKGYDIASPLRLSSVETFRFEDDTLVTGLARW